MKLKTKLKMPTKIHRPLSDTSPGAEAVQIGLLRKASAARHFGLMRSLSTTVIGLARRSFRAQRGGVDEIEGSLRLAASMYGVELAQRLIDRLPSDRRRSAMTEPDILQALRPVADALEEIGVRYYIGGSIASSVRGIPRATLHIDFVADLRMDDAAALVARLHSSYYVDEEAAREAVRNRGSFNLIHLSTMLKVDVFIPKGRAFDREAQGRATAHPLEEQPDARAFPIASAEDTVLAKLEWYRAGKEVSEQQWRDVLGVLKVRGQELDFEYLGRWAEQLGVLDLLRRALEDAALEGR